MKLKYQTNAKDYQDAFDTLLSRVDISEENVVSFYLGGLPAEIEMGVNMFRPKTFVDAYSLTKLQEATLEAIRKKNKIVMTSSVDEEDEYFEVEECDEVMHVQEELPQISLNARNGSNTFQTIRVTRKGEMVLGIQWEVERVPHVELLMLSVFPNTSIQLMRMPSEPQSIPKELQKMVEQYDDVFAVLRELPLQRCYEHKIPLLEGTQPVKIRPYRHLPIQKDAIDVTVRELLEAWVIKTSNSLFTSPIVMVKKKDNTWRMCVDYRQLNKNTVTDKFTIPIIEELIDELHGAVVFLFMPFGLTNAPSTFQALMNEVFKAFLRKFTLVFFNDILVYIQIMKEHVTHLQMEGVSTEPNKIRTMQDWPIPNTLKQLRGFLGLIVYYRRFIKGFASLSTTLTQLLKNNAFKWTLEAQLSFEALKKAIMEALVLELPGFNEPFVIETDALGVELGAVLQQKAILLHT
ncbi:reverse transcriptase [Tanacetum coccineum]